VTARHYADPQAIADARQRAAADALAASTASKNPSKTFGGQMVPQGSTTRGQKKPRGFRGSLPCEEGDSNPHGC
jgi:hypothetical protein